MKVRIFLAVVLVLAFSGGLYIRSRETPPSCLVDHPAFLKFCTDAAQNKNTFEKFKRHPLYSVFRESFSYEEGRSILGILKTKSPEMLKKDLIERIRIVDRYGGPRVYSYDPYGPFSPETLFHLKVAADIKRNVGAQASLKIIEIGGGCGDLCKILHEVLPIEQYTMVQLEEENELARTHLNHLHLDNVKLVSLRELTATSCDLLISAYAFTESSFKQQQEYLKKLFPHAERGYLICNFLPKHYGIKAFGKEALLKKIEKIHPQLRVLPEEPRTGVKNCTLEW